MLDAALERAAGESQLSRDDAARRLFARQFPGQASPESVEAILRTLREQLSLPATALPELAARRLQGMLDSAKRAGVDVGRRFVEAGVEERAPGSRVEIDVVEGDGPRDSRFRDALRRLGVPFRSPEARE
jgi:hypothetical protein